MSEKCQAGGREEFCTGSRRGFFQLFLLKLVKGYAALVALEAAGIRGRVGQKDFEMVLKRYGMPWGPNAGHFSIDFFKSQQSAS